MGQAFSEGLAQQYKSIGGNQENVMFIEEAIKASETQKNQSLEEIVR